MRLVDHAGLMAEPPGTVFQEFGENGLGSPSVFGAPLIEGRDYTCADLLPAENAADIGHKPAVLERFRVAITDYAIWYPSGFGRDGYFDDTRHYLIWDREDRERIAAWLLDPEKAAREMNDDAMAMIAVDWNIRAS